FASGHGAVLLRQVAKLYGSPMSRADTHVYTRAMRSFVTAMLMLFCAASFAQSYPAKPVRLVIGFPPGGGDDYHARGLAQKMTELIGQQVIVDYKSGAGGTIGWDYVAKSPADGYTLGMIGVSVAAAISIYPKFPFDPVRDLAPVSQVTLHQLMLVVHPS